MGVELAPGISQSLGFVMSVYAWLSLPNPTFGHAFVQKEALF